MINKLEHLYIHIPFCKNICTYCDFVRKIENNSNVIDEYIKHIINEINTIVYPLKTIYIGGGTPNSLNIKQLSLLLKHVQVKLAKNYEFTIELNPEFVTKEQVMVLKSYGVNRASIGVQTTNDSILHQFNRQHSFKDVLTAITKLQKVGISNISLDLLYGFNELNLNDINKAISVIKKNNIKHVS
jgi:oxygen-independent coproporphyrinogen-3 oxidase